MTARQPGSVPAGNPHDRLFRVLLDHPERAAVLIRSYLPSVVRARLADTPPKLVDGTFVNEALRGIQSDRLFEVRLKTGRPAFIYALCEHKSSADPGTPLQLLGYMVAIWKRHAGHRASRLRALPPIFPLVFYHGQTAWNVPRSIFDTIADDEELRPAVRSMAYTLHDLGRIDLERTSGTGAVLAGLMTLAVGSHSEVSRESLRRILAALPEDEPSFQRAVLDYIVWTYPIPLRMLERELRAAKPGRWEALMGTIAETWEQEGWKKGLTEGLTEGRARGLTEGRARGLTEGRAQGLTRLLERRFGTLPDALQARLRSADLDDLETWFDAAIDADNLTEVFGR